MTPLCRRRRQALRHRKGVTMSSTTKEIDVTERSQRTEKARRGITMRATGRCGTLFAASVLAAGGVRAQQMQMPAQEPRSEEHTSELQSRLHLVCRLPLEKKKTTRRRPSSSTRSTAP